MGGARRVAERQGLRPTRDRRATASQDSVISVHVGADVDAATRRPNGVGTRSFTRSPKRLGDAEVLRAAPDGNVINMVSHSDE